MKLKKLLLGLTTAAAAITLAAGISACSDGNADKDKDKDNNTEVTITYQFTGEFTNDTLRGYGFDYFVLLNLNSNGKVNGSGYNCLSMDSRTAAENSGFAEKWFRGSWEETKDEEDQDCIKLTAIYDADTSKTSMGGQVLSNTSTYYIYKKSGGNGLSDFKLQTPIFSGTTEYMTNMSQNTTPHKNADEFIKAHLYTWTAPTGYEAVFETTAESTSTSKIYLMPNGVADVYSGKKDPSNDTYKFVKGESWKWSYSGGALNIVNGDNTYTAQISGTTATLEYKVSVMGYEMSYKYSCADISKLTETAPATPDTPTVLAEFTDASGATLKFYADHTAKLSAYGGMLKPSFTWTVSNGTITLTDSENNTKTYTSTTAEGVTTIIYIDSLGGNNITITVTCNDISALTA